MAQAQYVRTLITSKTEFIQPNILNLINAKFINSKESFIHKIADRILL